MGDKSFEKELWQGCQKKQPQAQAMLYKAYFGKMLSVCLRYAKDEEEAKDILQEGFIKVFNHIDSFKGDGSLEGWVRRIVVNTAITHFHKQKKMFFDSIDGNTPDIQDTQEDDQLSEESLLQLSYDDILVFVRQLSPAYQAVFNLYVIENYTHREIAEMLQISEGTSKSNLAKARLKLQKLLTVKAQ